MRRRNITFTSSNIQVRNPGWHNGLPPAFDLIAITYAIVIWGNISRNKGTSAPSMDMAEVVKITGPTVILAIILGFADRGPMASPVRAFCALGLLVAVIYYGADIMKPWTTKTTKTKSGKSNG